MKKHLTGWEDGRMASLQRCGDVLLSGDTIVSCDRDEETRCPNCGAKLRLVWDVRIEAEDA